MERNIELICGWQSKARCNTGCAVLNSDQEIPALLLNVSKIVIGFIASVRKEQSTFNSRAIYHGSSCSGFVSLSAFLNKSIHINVLVQIIHSVDMQQVVCSLPVYPRIVGIRVFGIGCNL